MDTPVKSVSSASTSSPNPVAQFEDSPVFKYIDSFSPIKPLNRVQSFNMLSYASPKTSITSPATSCLQNSKKTFRSPLSHSLKPEITNGGNKVKIQICDNDIQLTELVVRKADYMESSYGVNKKETHESSGDDPGVSLTETDHKQDYGESVVVKEESAVDEPADLSTEHGDLTNSVSQTVNSELSPEFFIQRNSENGESSFGMASQDGCRWGKASVEDADQLLCDSPFEEGDFEETDNVCVDSDTLSFMENVLQPSEENIDDILNLESPLGPFEQYDVNLPYAYPNAGQPSACSPVVDEAVPNSHVEVHNTPYVEPHQLLPRRSLVYEVSGSSYRKVVSEASESSRLAITSERQLVSSKCKVYNCSPELPGIGLHLNAFAKSEKIVVKHEISTYKRQLITIPCTTSILHSQSSDVKSVDSSFDIDPMQNDLEPSNSSGKLNENACQSLAVTESEKFKQNLNKRKRCMSDLVEDNTCKRCNCKRSKCLKLYCECFAAGLYCVEPCSCQGCLNKPAFEETVLETRRLIELRNPLAFAPKVIRFSNASENRDELHKTPASARHKRGCNCKKSGCLKKYCECFQGGVGCSLGCRCEGCRNSFGRKHDVDFLNVDTEDQEETKSSQISRNPSGLVGLHLQFPSFSSRLLQPCSNHGLAEEANFSCNDNLETFKDENDVLTSTSVKSVSPNSKRVSPQIGPTRSSPTKLCRKLILRSISPFPELPDN